ncbi:MAG: MerR family transcriptional regulator [Chromatiales bacterium]|nr:MerR family transcriptional regulator [Chromatiales bacterium]
MTTRYKIGEVAERLGTTIRSIRYYEEEGLLDPPRTQGGTRLYGERQVLRLQAILHLADNGFSLDEIRLLASAREDCRNGDESSRAVAERLSVAAEELAARIDGLERLRGEILKARTLVGRCRGCTNEPTSQDCPECPVRKQAGRKALPSLIWDQED